MAGRGDPDVSPLPLGRRALRGRAALALLALALVAGPLGTRAAAADAAPRAEISVGGDADAADQADATAMTPEARALYERGLSLYGAKDYAGAIRAFEDGFAREPRREFLFANAQARRLAGDCRGAVPLYQRFLGMSPPAVQESATQIALGRCAQQMATTKIEPVAPAAPPPPPRPAPRPTLPPPPWTHDRAGAALLATGVVGLAVGGGFLAAALAARPPADAPTDAAFDGGRARAEARLSIAVVSFATGGALVAAGVARYVWVRHERRRMGATLTIVPGGLALGGSF